MLRRDTRSDLTSTALVALLTLAALAGGWALARAQDETAEPTTPRTLEELRKADLLAEGKKAYDMYCSGCHGVDGDGKGPAARFLDPLPRDFTTAAYKFRSTPSGALPTNADLHRVLSQGVLGTSMPSWYLMPENQKYAVIEYLKTFSEEWESEYAYEPAMAIPGKPEYVGSSSSVTRGGELYGQMGCGQCHGETGQGDGPASNSLTDDWGNPIKAFDFTSGALKGGASARDVYRTFTTGLNGTPMPSYADILDDTDRWHLVSYILSLRTSGGEAKGR